MRHCWKIISVHAVFTLLAAIVCGCDSAENPREEPPGAGRLAVESETGSATKNVGWPRLHGPNQDGKVAGTLKRPDWKSRPPAVVWSRNVGNGYSSPVVRDGRVILRHRKGDVEILECFSASDGKSVWSNETPTTYRCKYEYSSGPYSTPVIDEESVYSLSAQGVLQCCRFSDGRRVWERDLVKEYDVESGMFAIGTSPLIDGERIIVAIGGRKQASSVVALNKRDGREIWTGGAGKGTMASPRIATIHGKRYLFALLDAGLFALDPETGSEFWRVRFHQSNPEKVVGTSPAISGDLVLITGFSMGSVCVRVQPDGTFKELWRKRRNLDSQYQNLVCIQNYAFGFASRDRTLRCLDMVSGEVRWKWKSESGVGSLIAIGNRMLVFTERGRLACFQIGTNKPVLESITSDALLGYPVFTSPALCKDRLIVRNEKLLRGLQLPNNPLNGERMSSTTTRQKLIQSSRAGATVDAELTP